MLFLQSLRTERAAKAIVFLLLFAMSSRVSLDPDMWWHIRLGEQILETGQPVYADELSHSRQGVVHRNHSWLAQIVMFGLWRLAGHLGLSLFVSALAIGGMFCLYRAGKGSIYMQGFVLVFGAACAAAFWSPRPQMFTFFFSALLVYALFDLKRCGRDRLRWLPLLFLLWGNCHGGYIFGFVLIGAFALGEALNSVFAFDDPSIPIHKIRKLVSIALLSVIVVPLNPLGLAVFAVPFETIGISGLREYIQEWASPDLSQPYTWGFIILLFLLAASIWSSRRRLDATETIFAVGALCLALMSGRNLPLFAIAAVPIASARLDEALTGRGWIMPQRKREAPLRALVNLALVTIVAAGALLHLAYVSNDDTVNSALALNYPLGAIRQLNASEVGGNLFNSYNWGGYLIFTARRHPVFIDGRTDLHRDLLVDYIAALGTPAWRDIFAKWDIGIALIESTSTLAARLETASDWRRDYADEMASLFVRTQP